MSKSNKKQKKKRRGRTGSRVGTGNVLINRDQPVNPLQWNTVFWMSHQEAGAVSGLFKPAK